MASVTYGKCIMANVIMAKIFMAKILWQMKLSPFFALIFNLFSTFWIRSLEVRVPFWDCSLVLSLSPIVKFEFETLNF